MIKNRGQITILVLLLGLLGLTVSLSVASRSLSDLKQTTVVDSGTKALAGAEAGVQYALAKLTTGTAVISPSCVNASPTTAFSGTGLPQGLVKVEYVVCPVTDAPFVTFSDVASDDVAEVDLSVIGSGNTKGVDIIWSNSRAAVEVIHLNSSYVLTRYAYNGQNTTFPNFTASYPVDGTWLGYVNPNCQIDGAYNTGSSTSQNNTDPTPIPAQTVPVSTSSELLRIKPLIAGGGTTDIAVCPRTAGNSPAALLGSTNYRVIGSAQTVDGSVKRVQVIKYASTLPAVFDNVIFSGGDLVK